MIFNNSSPFCTFSNHKARLIVFDQSKFKVSIFYSFSFELVKFLTANNFLRRRFQSEHCLANMSFSSRQTTLVYVSGEGGGGAFGDKGPLSLKSR